MIFYKRSLQTELLDETVDSGKYTAKEYEECLFQLGEIGKVFHGDALSLKALKEEETKRGPFTSFLDVGCGGGFFVRQLAEHFPKARVQGIDLDKHAVAYAQKYFPYLSFEAQDFFALEETPTFDVVNCTLMCHHLSDEKLVAFLQKAQLVGKKLLLINDLHRSFLSYVGFAALSPYYCNNRMIRHDGLISIKKGFWKRDWQRMLALAGYSKEQCQISWHWPFRWIVRVEL